MAAVVYLMPGVIELDVSSMVEAGRGSRFKTLVGEGTSHRSGNLNGLGELGGRGVSLAIAHTMISIWCLWCIHQIGRQGKSPAAGQKKKNTYLAPALPNPSSGLGSTREVGEAPVWLVESCMRAKGEGAEGVERR